MDVDYISLPKDVMEALMPDPSALQVYIYLACQASIFSKKIFYRSELVEVQRGQLLTCRHAISRFLGISEAKVRGVLRRLEKLGLIKVEASKRFTRISILDSMDFSTQ